MVQKYFNLSVSDVITAFNTSETDGLSSDEASRRIEEYGYNEIKESKRQGFFIKFLLQFKSFMILILLIAAVISGVVGVIEGEGLTDTFVILGILVLNAFIGAFQERKAESSLEALKKMAAPMTKVIRDGVISEIPARELVPGDIVILETGVIIPADMRLIEAVNLKTQESALTGESVPIEKNTMQLQGEQLQPGDQTNMVFSGGVVTYGRGRGLVVATGMKTEVGKIADMLQQTEDTGTPLSHRLSQLGKVLGIAALSICAVIFIVGVLYGNSVIDMFMTAVSLAVAAIPEGLPAVSTVVLAIGVQRMVKRNAIIRSLPSVETLGSATVICTDKTGTLTQNRMTIVEAYVNHRRDVINREAPGAVLNAEEEKLLLIALLCSDAHLSRENGELKVSGDPTETALIDFGLLYGIDKNEVEEKYQRLAEIPFDSERKRMSTVNRISEQVVRVNVKGGVDEVLKVCSRILINGEVRDINPEDRMMILRTNELMATSALRVLAMAYKDLTDIPDDMSPAEVENNLIFMGMLGMIDPPRPEVIDAVRKCYSAGIRPVMITGDHKLTALAIASEIGIYRDNDSVITGDELENTSDETFNENIARYSVYARVSPVHKVRIVKAWQKKKEVVAMTGDGVNDAPALKQADIGAAMGIAGTDVAKGAADMVLTDDNFATIVSAVEEGRRIYDNILKVVQFLLSTNIGEIILILVASVLNLGIPLLPIHILWVNLVTDSLPALALSIDPAEENIMKRKPRKATVGFMTRGMVWRILYQGIMIGLIPLAAFITGMKEGDVVLGRTMAFATLMFAQLVHVRNLHSNTRSSLAINPLRNKPLVGAIIASAGLALIVLLIPSVSEAFSLTAMDGKHWLIVILMSFIPIILVDLFKLLKINTTKDEYNY